MPQPAQSSRLTLVPLVVPMRHVEAPPASTLSENWTWTESFAQSMSSALSQSGLARSHSR
jgi:hypothetical protein